MHEETRAAEERPIYETVCHCSTDQPPHYMHKVLKSDILCVWPRRPLLAIRPPRKHQAYSFAAIALDKILLKKRGYLSVFAAPIQSGTPRVQTAGVWTLQLGHFW